MEEVKNNVLLRPLAEIAQLVEQRTENPRVLDFQSRIREDK
jgi:hypothetical protein